MGIRYRNAIRPGQVLPNGQIADPSTAVAETLEAVKDIYDSGPYAGIACAMKNAGVGVGLPDWGRCRLLVKEGRFDSYRRFLHQAGTRQRAGAGAIRATGLTLGEINTAGRIFHGSGFRHHIRLRQTLVTGGSQAGGLETVRGLKEHSLDGLEGKEYYGSIWQRRIRWGRRAKPRIPWPYGYATQYAR